jgi:hypothetical protein
MSSVEAVMLERINFPGDGAELEQANSDNLRLSTHAALK